MAAVSLDHFHRKTSLRSAKKLPSKADFELVNLKGNTGEIFIAIAETTAPTNTKIIAPPRARVIDSSRPSSPLARTPLQSRAASPSQNSNPPRSHTSSPTLVRSGSTGSTATHSPVMRSMFPRFDPSLPLAQQKYYPNMERMPRVPTWTHDTFTRPEYSPSLYSQPGSPSLSAKDRLKQKKPGFNLSKASASPLSTPQLAQPILSTPEELLDLWSIANGQGNSSTIEEYTFGLHCPSSTTIHLTSSTSPIYTLTTSPSPTITRTHPLNPSLTITIFTPTLHAPTETSPLLSSLFPSLAELIAIDQSSNVAVLHKLPRSASAELQAEAVKRARAREESRVVWDSDSDGYFIIHPTIDDGEPAAFSITISGDEQIIGILAPTTTSTTTTTEKTPLLSLNLPRKTLTVYPKRLVCLPSLYALDTLLSTTLLLVMHLHLLHRQSSTTPLPYRSLHQTLHLNPNDDPQTFIFAPPPTLSSPPSRSKRGGTIKWKPSSSSRRNKPLLPLLPFTTNRSKSSPLSLSSSPSPSRSRSLSKFAPPPIDLSSFQPFAANDEALPKGTRAVLKVLYWGFGALVWMMGLCVGMVAAGVVGLGGLVGRL
ncbi:hypothetical protein MMC14_005753 [Varicellaria rhodocarpa]|nr:hypothetical protein [Varicellaria rhodocarpa]